VIFVAIEKYDQKIFVLHRYGSVSLASSLEDEFCYHASEMNDKCIEIDHHSKCLVK
jgi:hypothetical protein